MPESKPASQPRGETPTPRTDALLSGVDSFGNIPTMEDRFQRMCRHARTLERELTAAESALEGANQWRNLSVTAIAAENPSVMEYCRQFDQTILDLRNRLDAAEKLAMLCRSLRNVDPAIAEAMAPHIAALSASAEREDKGANNG